MVVGRGLLALRPTLAEWEHAFHAGTKYPVSHFYDLLHIHMNDEVDRVARYDYDRGKPRRKKVQSLPPFETTVDPCFTYDGTNAMSIIRMPFWARWNAARIGFNQDWSPVRLVIGPEIK